MADTEAKGQPSPDTGAKEQPMADTEAKEQPMADTGAKGQPSPDTVAKEQPMADTERLSCDCEVIHAEVVERVQTTMPAAMDLYHLAQLYKMFADPTRLRILWALSQEVMCVCDLAVLLGMTKSAISHQLKSLRLADLVTCERQGKIVYYSLADDHVRDIFRQGFEHVHE